MQDPERPPLPPLAYEQIDQMLHRADLSHWPAIAEMRGSKYYPPDHPVPPRTPQHLLGHIRFYATTLFRAEADQYERFRTDKRYQRWLSLLSDCVIARVKDALEKLESRDPMSLILGYHGLNWLEVETDLKTMLAAIVTQYGQGTTPSQAKIDPVPSAQTVKVPEADVPNFAVELKRLLNEARWKPEDVPDHMQIDCRTVYRHLRGSIPSQSTIWAYEEAFAKRLGRKIELPQMPAKRQHASRMSAKSQ